MTQRIVVDFPPNYDAIAAAFPIRAKRGVIFSFGPVIYNPHNVPIAPHFLAHELAHGMRQGVDAVTIGDWWKRYIDDREFRLAEELVAHIAEYRCLAEGGGRNQRRTAAKAVAARLSSPIYGRMIGRNEALRALRSEGP